MLAKKGGAGKSTLVLLLASAARARGLSVWVADFDPQCNVSALLHGEDYKAARAAAARKEGRRPGALLDVLSEEDPGALDLQRVVYPANEKWSGVHLLSATPRLDLIERETQDEATAQRWMRALDDLEANPPDDLELPDLILKDTRPAFNLLTVMAARGSNIVFAVVNPERFPVQGLRDAWGTLRGLVEAGGMPRLETAAVVMNLIDRREYEHRTRAEEIEKHFASVLWTPEMPDRTVIAQAISAGRPIHDYPDPRAAEPAKVADTWLDKIMDGEGTTG